MTSEDRVRQAWKRVTILKSGQIMLGALGPFDNWDQAAVFTDLRLNEIRDLREEINLVNSAITSLVQIRVVSRLARILREKIEDMR